MGNTLPSFSGPNPVRTSDNIGQRTPKRPDFAKTMSAAIRQHYGSVKEAAYALGECDPSLMVREFNEGNFERFDRFASDQAMSAVIAALYDTYCTQIDLCRLAREAIQRSTAAREIRELRAVVNTKLDHMLENL